MLGYVLASLVGDILQVLESCCRFRSPLGGLASALRKFFSSLVWWVLVVWRHARATCSKATVTYLHNVREGMSATSQPFAISFISILA